MKGGFSAGGVESVKLSASTSGVSYGTTLS